MNIIDCNYICDYIEGYKSDFDRSQFTSFEENFSKVEIFGNGIISSIDKGFEAKLRVNFNEGKGNKVFLGRGLKGT